MSLPPDPPPELKAKVKLHHATNSGHTEVMVDRCIAPLIQALNDGGFQTISSCCGHNQCVGSIALEDGRVLLIAKDYDEWSNIDAMIGDRDIHGDKWLGCLSIENLLKWKNNFDKKSTMP